MTLTKFYRIHFRKIITWNTQYSYFNNCCLFTKLLCLTQSLNVWRQRTFDDRDVTVRLIDEMTIINFFPVKSICVCGKHLTIPVFHFLEYEPFNYSLNILVMMIVVPIVCQLLTVSFCSINVVLVFCLPQRLGLLQTPVY